MEIIEKILEQIFSYLFDINKRTHWMFFLSSILIAYFVFKYQKRSGSFFAYFFDKKIWLGKSSMIDFNLLIINSIIKVILLGSFAVIGLRIAFFVNNNLESIFGQPIQFSTTETVVYFSITLALMRDFFFFFIHLLAHKIPFLWEFHKVHHSATQMNPFTQYRLHPVEMIINNFVAVFVLGFCTGLFDFMSNDTFGEYSIFGLGVLNLMFYSFGANLRHSHIQLKYPKFLERFFISPYQHQIHHSNKPEHYSKNLGGKLAIWDWMFGTLIYSKQVKSVEFGLGKEDYEYDTFAKNLIFSPARNLIQMFNPFKKRKVVNN
ncbi:MAG: sterol desaturase family protein [Flavobacteriia bacterium]|nr:sterol desaturase family protein [Flavobacteriia bacterium]